MAGHICRTPPVANRPASGSIIDRGVQAARISSSPRCLQLCLSCLAASTKLGGERPEGPAPVSGGGHRTDAAVFDLRRGTRLVGPRNDSSRSAMRTTAAVCRSMVRGGKSVTVQNAALDCHEQTPMTTKLVFNLLPRHATFNTSSWNILQFANNGLSYHRRRGFAVDRVRGFAKLSSWPSGSVMWK